MRRRQVLRIAVPACALALGLAPVVARADLIPAPPASASGVAAQVGSLVDVSRTGATADSGSSSADASVVRVGGEPLLDLGGTQTGNGQTGGSLVDTGGALPARVQVAPWSAAADGSGTSTRHASSSAAVARASVPDVAEAGVLTSDSEASHTDQASSGRAVTDGFQAGVLGAIRLVLLHSEVSSTGGGHSYLLGLNGTEIGTDDQLGASPLCAFQAPGLLSLSCLTASGGTGAVSEAASQVAQVTPALDALAPLNPVAAFTTAATSGTGQTAPAATPEATSTLGAEASRAASPTAAAATDTGGTTGSLPRTGMAAVSLALAAAVLLLLGRTLRRFGIRPAMA